MAHYAPCGGLRRKLGNVLAALRWSALALGLACTALAVLAGARIAPTSYVLELAPPFVAYGEHAYNTRLPVLGRPPLVAPSDGKERSGASQVELREDGVPIGPAHEAHTKIVDVGGGAYSHWGETLYFSASDNTDPNTNGLRYTLEVPLLLPSEWWTLFAAGALVGGAIWLSDRRARARVFFVTWATCAFVGGTLLLVNLFGLFFPRDLPTRFASRDNDTTLDHAEAQAALGAARRDFLAGMIDDAAFLDAVTAAVNQRMTNVHQRFVDEEHAMRLDARENWLLAALNHDGRYDNYEFQDPGRALRRGLGTCGAQSITLLRLLAEDGIDGQLWGSGVHVVARVTSPDGQVFVLDPDYGVTLRGEPTELREDPARVREAYLGRRQATSDDVLPVIQKHYAQADPPDLLPLEALVGQRYDAKFFHGLDPLEFERVAYSAKWGLPLLLLLPGLLRLLSRRRRAQRS
ncbi:MAG: hypothetical protein DHS20C15_24820 [Planctomycetota bacterium]|nr:MAG: hypothetical protein DHS20C15_24820 [Planctomycetota bacterium]